MSETNDELDSDVNWSLSKSDIEWIMDWPKNGSLEKDPELVFEKEKALALLLINNVVFLNSNWYQDEWPEQAKKSINVIVNCNDIFAWAGADGEELPYKEIENLYRLWIKDKTWGSAIWCMIQRKEMPQKPVEEDIRKAGIWDLDSLNLSSNTTDEQVQSWLRAAAYEFNKHSDYN